MSDRDKLNAAFEDGLDSVWADVRDYVGSLGKDGMEEVGGLINGDDTQPLIDRMQADEYFAVDVSWLASVALNEGFMRFVRLKRDEQEEVV